MKQGASWDTIRSSSGQYWYIVNGHVLASFSWITELLLNRHKEYTRLVTKKGYTVLPSKTDKNSFRKSKKYIKIIQCWVSFHWIVIQRRLPFSFKLLTLQNGKWNVVNVFPAAWKLFRWLTLVVVWGDGVTYKQVKIVVNKWKRKEEKRKKKEKGERENSPKKKGKGSRGQNALSDLNHWWLWII